MFYELWEFDRDSAMRYLFELLPKNREDDFIHIFDFVRQESPNTFYNNISHIVGVFNQHSIPDELESKLLDKQNEEYSNILDTFISKQYQQPFARFNQIRNKRKLFELLNPRQYGSWKTLVRLLTIYPDDNKLRLIITTLFNQQIKEDVRNKTFSYALESAPQELLLQKYIQFPKQTKTPTKTPSLTRVHIRYHTN